MYIHPVVLTKAADRLTIKENTREATWESSATLHGTGSKGPGISEAHMEKECGINYPLLYPECTAKPLHAHGPPVGTLLRVYVPFSV